MDLNQYLDKIYQEAKFAKEEVAKNYDRWLNHYRGQFWPSKRPDWRVSAVINHLAELIQREVAYLTDSRPVIRVVARNDHLQPVAEVLENIIAALWEERNWQQKQQELLILAAIFGAAFSRCVWNPQLDDGRGDIDIVVGDPRVYLVDPFCLRANQLDEAEYIIHEYVVPKSVLDEQYPHLASKIKPTYGAEEEEKGFKHFLRKLLFGTEREQKAILPRCLVQEFWIKDRTRVELEEGQSVRKYPGGRHIVRVGHLILKDEPNPYIDERFPIDMFDWSFNPNSAWGISEVEYLHSLQEMYNKLMAIIVEHAILTCNAVWIGEEDALSPAAWSRLTNKPGAIVRVRPGKTLRREPPPPLPAYIQNAVQYLENQMQVLSGMTDVMRGERGALTSGVAIESLQVASQAIIRLRARSFEQFLARIGQKLISRIFQFYTTDRVIKILGPDGNIREYEWVRKQIMDPILKYYEGDYRQKLHSAFRDLQFKVVEGSSLAMNKIQKVMMAITFYRMGVIDEEALLEIAEWPHRKEILERKAQMMQQQQGRPTKVVKVPEPSRRMEAEMRAKGMSGEVLKP